MTKYDHIFSILYVEMFVPLQQMDFTAVKRLFQDSFDTTEDKNLQPAWKHRRQEASLGYWRDDVLLAAAIVRGNFLEFIFVSDVCRGCGIGTQLLQAVLAVSPALHLTPVNDPRVIRWYESQGFHLYSRNDKRLVYRRLPYTLRSTRAHTYPALSDAATK